MRILIIFSFFVLMACQGDRSLPPVDTKAETTSIHAKMEEQELAWNSGDIEGFMKHYWHSDSLVFVGKRGLTKGWQQTLDNYRKSYPDANAMGKLQFTNLQTDIIDASNAMVIGKWELFRSADTLSGHYMLFWKKMAGQWCIIADHSS